MSVSDPVQSRIFAIARDVARGVANEVGDGRKTALLLWAEMVSHGIDTLLSGADEQALVTSLADAQQRAVVLLRNLSRPAKAADIETVASCAASNQRDVGVAMVAAMKHAGKEGVLWVQRKTNSSLSAKTIEITVRQHAFDGLKVPAWFAEAVPTLERDLLEPAVILCDGEVKTVSLLPALEQIIASKRPVLVVARKFDEVALATMALNTTQGAIFCLPLQLAGPRHEGVLDDIALLSGARVFNPVYGNDIHNLKLQDVGTASSAFVSTNEFRLTPSAALSKEALATSVGTLRKRMEAIPSEYERQLLQMRLARLVGAHVIIEAIGVSEREAEAFHSEVADAMNAARGAVEEGVVPGGGKALSLVADSLNSGPTSDLGTKLLIQALRVPAQVLKLGSVGSEDPLDSTKHTRVGLTLAVEAAIRTLRTRTIEVVTDSPEEASADGEAPF